MSDETREAVCTWCDHSAQGTALHNDEGRHDSCGAPDHGLAGTFVRTVHDPPVEEIHDDRCRRQYANQIGVDTCDCWKRLPAPQAEGDVREAVGEAITAALEAHQFPAETDDGYMDHCSCGARPSFKASLSVDGVGLWHFLHRQREVADAVLSSGLVVPAAIHKVATDALEAGDACGAVGCRALAERDAAWERAETAEREWRDGWADWISNGASAAGLPEPFTLDTVIGWLRSDRTPFGCSSTAALDTTPRA